MDCVYPRRRLGLGACSGTVRAGKPWQVQDNRTFGWNCVGGQRGPEQLDQGGVSSTCTGGVARRAGFQGHVESECLWRGPVVRAQTCGSGQGQRGKETGPGPSPGASGWTGGGNETESESRGWGEPEGGARAKGGTFPGGSRRERHRKPRPDGATVHQRPPPLSYPSLDTSLRSEFQVGSSRSFLRAPPAHR